MPLYTIGLGSPEPARDLELTELLVDDVVFVDDAVRFQAKLLRPRFRRPEGDVRLKERDTRLDRPQGGAQIASNEGRGSRRRPAQARGARSTGPRTPASGTFILEVEPKPRELQTENNRIERMVTVRKEKLKVLLVDSEPRYEYRYLKNYLEREETIDLSVVLLSSDPEYSEQDRSALPTFPAAKDELFAYDVVLIGDADPSFLSHSQMQNLVRVRHRKGGRHPLHRRRGVQPAGYRGTPLELLLPIELADARNPTAVGHRHQSSFRPELTAEGRASPIFRFGDDEAASTQIWQQLPELFWYFEAPARSPAALVLAEHPTATGSRRQAAAHLYQFARRGQGDVPRVRRHLAVAVPRRRPLLRPFLGSDDPVPGPLEARRPAPGRDPDRPQPLPARPADPAPRALPQSRPWRRRAATVTVQIERNGPVRGR